MCYSVLIIGANRLQKIGLGYQAYWEVAGQARVSVLESRGALHKGLKGMQRKVILRARQVALHVDQPIEQEQQLTCSKSP